MKETTIGIGYFKQLEEQILDITRWNQNKFYVFDHEAGTGKSRFTQKCIGEMTRTKSHRVLYVQKFKKDNELVNTVERINKYAGEEVAGYYCSDMKKEEKKQLQRVQVLCVTHQMYYQICKGNNLELVKGREILIIDEFPQLLKELYITKDDIANLWSKFNRDGGYAGKELAQMLLDMLLDEEENNSIKCIDFRLEKHRDLGELLVKIKDSSYRHSKDELKVLDKIETLLNQKFFISSNKFISYEKEAKLYKLRNNILLDANGSFDYRYLLSNNFEVIKQEKKLDYSNTEFIHYKVKTTKTELKKTQAKIHEKAVNEVDWENTDKILFITDKNNKELLEKEIIKYLSVYGDSLEKIQENYNKEISIDHFGNLIGKNNYRKYDSIVLTKTPNYAYNSYVMDYCYINDDIVDGTIIEPFKNIDVEKIRISTLAGEFYQAIKRINRDNKLKAKIYLFSDAQDAIEIVRDQLMNVKYKSVEIEADYKTNNRPKNHLNKAKEILLRNKKEGKKEVNKKEIRDELGIEAPNLSKLLKELQVFGKENDIIIEKGRKILFV